MPRAVIQVPAFREPGMVPVLERIAAQEPPDGWDVDRQAWVTLHPPDRDLCTTWQAALEARGFEPHEAPQGKLSARNAAHNHAVANGADVVITWDSDAPPLQDGTLAALLEPFGQDGDVVATNGRPRSPATPIGLVNRLAAGIEDRVSPQMHGQLSAISAEGWRAAGPFDDTLDQTEIDQVRSEEEFDFRRRLENLGTVADVREAVVLNDTRRSECRIPRSFNRFGNYPMEDWCQDRGELSFAPRDERRRSR